jgi:hypothetical protein
MFECRRAATSLVLSLALFSPVVTHADDQPVAGTKLKLKRSGSGKEKLTFISKDDAFPVAGIDPMVTGATIELFAQNGEEIEALSIPAGAAGWSAKSGGYAFKNPDAPGGSSQVKLFQMKHRGLKIIAASTAIGLASTSAPVAIRIRMETARVCSLFGAATIRRDETNRFEAANAPANALVDCYDGTILGVVPTCGDEIHSAGEECDGPLSCHDDVLGDLDCVVPGVANECTCCSNGFPSFLPCCQPSIVIPMAQLDKQCIPTSCAPPFQCGPGSMCQLDETCCSSLGSLCDSSFFGDLLTCCPGTICDRIQSLSLGVWLGCCIAAGDACENDTDCCSSVCEPGGTCAACAPDGAACGIVTPCCSGNCPNGVCVP